MKILLIGYGRHGKDTVAEYLRDSYGFTYKSSSWHCAENVVFPAIKNLYGYKSVEECFADRSNHRQEWYDLISDYCVSDPSRIGREIFSVSDMYCGLRNKREFQSIRNNGLVDVVIWVDRSDHLPPEDKTSNTLEPWMADYILDNNRDIAELHRNVDDLIMMLAKRKK
jgi:hypothetical protein